MRRHRILLSIFLTSLGVITAPVFAEIPSTVVDDENSSIWVAAEAVTETGRLHLDLLPLSTQSRIRSQLESARTERQSADRPDELSRCSFLTLTSHSSKPPSRPLESPQDLASTAEIILSGTVTDVAQGFYYGGEATVIELQIAAYVKGPLELAPEAKLLLVYPWAELELEGEVICYRGERGDAPPQVGSTAVLALDRIVDLSEKTFFQPRDYEFFFERRDGSVSASSGYPRVELGFDDFLVSMKEAGSER